jgi:hypothetical protein
MQATQHSAETRSAATEPQQFPPLELERRPNVSTDQAAHYLLRRPQTLRQWACLENGPLRPLRINGRLAWPMAEIRRVAAVAQ